MIEINNLSKFYSDQFGNKIQLFKNISFTIEDAQITTIIAPVGSGKTSLLKILSGLEKPSEGSVDLKSDNTIIFLSSEPSSYPWLSVKENILFGLKKYDEAKINELINVVGLEGYGEHFPNNKSIGFRFRIALARSLAHNPECICIDEPFNKMDLQTKSEVYLLIRKISFEQKTTFLFTTTNLTEAIFLSDQIYLMGKEPASVFESIKIDLDAVRDLSIINTDKFKEYITQVETHFKKIDAKKILFKTI